jgi:AraC family transcriptional activator of mar-sox-rob regulon
MREIHVKHQDSSERNLYNIEKPDFHDQLIKELLYWIEVNLNDRLTMERASKKTGYSPWYLQRLFKSKTGYALGKYIRDRRLTMAAIALRLTNMPILDISLYYSYDSQQTFTRSFKKNFAETPAVFRRNTEWNMGGITAPLLIDEFPAPSYEIIELPEMAFVGKTQRHSYPIEALFHPKNHVHRDAMHQYIKDPTCLDRAAWGLADCRASDEVETVMGMDMLYTVARELGEESGEGDCDALVENLVIPAGRYLKFDYTYELDRLNDYILYMYSVFLPTQDLQFRLGHDLEKYTRTASENGITCEYYIPIA